MTLPPVPHLDDVRLVVTDMDGTLLDADGHVPDGLWPLLARLHEAGVLLVPASGRQHATITAAFPADRTPGHEDLVVIAENGTYVTRGGTTVATDAVEPASVAAIVHAVRGLRATRDGGAVVAGLRSAYVERSDAEFLDRVGPYYTDLTVVDDLLAVDDQVLKVAVYDHLDSATGPYPALEHLRDDLQVVVSSPHWVDVMNHGVNKGVALRRLQSALGIDAAQTMVFGDYLNDLEMMSAATWSYAMAGAHPEVLAHAAHTAPSNADHGVVQVLRAMLDAA
ncbi:HAD family hydrolase [Isoptericola sp. b408]|uniref:HAD family hydrolase n=1 Tax=Isoptericola sp. b408 TaxID=3064653 RepID=UPI002713F9D0|nr:HAD family hydrolase [Isoptericola sp. b408]MDO8150215.1 HAD family hydrolase [Isoptericola sp. b408]